MKKQYMKMQIFMILHLSKHQRSQLKSNQSPLKRKIPRQQQQMNQKLKMMKKVTLQFKQKLKQKRKQAEILLHKTKLPKQLQTQIKRAVLDKLHKQAINLIQIPNQQSLFLTMIIKNLLLHPKNNREVNLTNPLTKLRQMILPKQGLRMMLNKPILFD